ncbi:MAG TPA: hypothetical protein VGM11_04480 [Acidobacteriaceae bacterium]|jgi:hypothetical protein
MQPEHSRSYWLALSLQAIIVLLYCGWVLSMPVFPSQDGPLHLYCVEIFRQLLAHKSTVYTHDYYIGHYFPPYSFYYYGLVVLGKVTSLEMADKLIVCLYFILLPVGLRSLTRAVSGKADWAPLLMTPVFINWPLMMGFVNYCIASVFACFALAVWCRNQAHPTWRSRLLFLFWIVIILFTHPVPWMFVLVFCFFELALRLLRSRMAKEPDARRAVLAGFRGDLLVVIAGCMGYFYLKLFSSKLPPTFPGEVKSKPPYLQQVWLNLFDYLRTRGLTVFTGTSGSALVQRLGISIVFAIALIFAVRYALRNFRSKGWSWPLVWTIFAVLFTVALPFVPLDLNGSFYFAWRLLLLLYLSVAVAASAAMAKNTRGTIALAVVAVFVSIFSLALGVHRISPVARAIATLRDAPVVQTDKPGLLTRPFGVFAPAGLFYNPEYWAGADYFRHHELVLYNTGWLNLPIIPIKPRPEELPKIDWTYFVETPMPGNRLFRTDATARDTLSRVGFVLAMRVNAPEQQSPFTETVGSPTADPWAAGWSCLSRPDWKLCVPPGQTLGAAKSQ